MCDKINENNALITENLMLKQQNESKDKELKRLRKIVLRNKNISHRLEQDITINHYSDN